MEIEFFALSQSLDYRIPLKEMIVITLWYPNVIQSNIMFWEMSASRCLSQHFESAISTISLLNWQCTESVHQNVQSETHYNTQHNRFWFPSDYSNMLSSLWDFSTYHPFTHLCQHMHLVLVIMTTTEYFSHHWERKLLKTHHKSHMVG